MEFAKNFRDLEVYKLSRQLAKEVFEASKKFPKEEMYSLTDQVRRSSRSIGAQLAEAWGKRSYERHFVSKLTTPMASNWRHNTGLKLRWIALIVQLNSLAIYCANAP